MRRFECVDSKSSKFWEVEQEGSNLNIRWGKMGTNGQSQSKPFADERKASIAMNKLIAEKTGKGYVEVNAGEGAHMGGSPVRATPSVPVEQMVSTTAIPASVTHLQQQAQGPTEMAELTGLPSVLVNPPWLAKTTQQKPTVFELATLELEPVEYWAEGEREGKVEGILRYDYQKKRLGEAQQSSRSLLEGLGFYRLEALKEVATLNASVLEKGAVLGSAAEQALKAGDGIRLAQIWLEYTELLPSPELHLSIYYVNILAISSDQTAVEFANAVLPCILRNPIWSFYDEELLPARYGLAVLPVLRAIMAKNLDKGLQCSLNFGVVEFAPIAARAFAKLKTLKEQGKSWLLRFPEHAICGLLAPALGKPGEARECAVSALRLLASQGHKALIFEVAARYSQPEVSEEIQRMLDENRLDRFPARRAKMPEFWQPGLWRRPCLKNGRALPDQALEHLGTMMTFPTQDGVYPGLKQVKEACTPDSLNDFLWDVFSAWLSAGGQSKTNWALTMLGYLGNDDIARKLTPLIRLWPGEAAHARAVTGLDVLANIGTDVALMMLNGIAQKLKFKGLQDKAREKIDEIAESRGLTVEELEDRLAPDLGLESNGSLRLDFGPRQFKVGFDENLKPYVREMEGVREGERMGPRLADLPKPKKTDDPALSKAAVERFKLLKKDARTIASQQVIRLETAMCSRRRWTAEVFQQFLVEHPLVRHLVQRLVWGVYQCSEGASYGGTLLACFRVNEEGSLTTATDDEYTLPPGEEIKIGLPHALELSPELAGAFGQLLADYELLQPFTQLGRETYSLEEAVQERWKGKVVATGRVLGLVNKGWRRGAAQDAGIIPFFSKPICHNHHTFHLILELDPGIIVGLVNEYPEQTLCALEVSGSSQSDSIPFSALDPIILSEMVRDMESLYEAPG